MTLANKNRKNSDWIPFLQQSDRFVVSSGKDGTGNILSIANIHHLCNQIRKETMYSKEFSKGVFLVVADGGFTLNDRKAMVKEVYHAKLFVSETLCALKCLRQGGVFIMKMYHTYTTFSFSLLFLLSVVFDVVKIVKPIKSRMTNDEKYVYCSGFKRDHPQMKFVFDLLYSYIRCSDRFELFPVESFKNSVFFDRMVEMNHELAMKQVASLFFLRRMTS